MRMIRAGGRHGTPWRAAGAAVLLAVAMAGAALLGVATSPDADPRPPRPDSGRTAYVDPDLPAGQEAAQGGTPALPRSQPTTVSIRQIGVQAQVMQLGTNPDGTVQTPPLEQSHLTGWYAKGASPGEVGNAVIIGHVDNRDGPAVFWELGALQPGSTIEVGRQDGRSVVFTVDEVRSYPKTAFPTDLVYGPNDRPGLRLVTCGGEFDQKAQSYLENTVVFASPAR
ncbi:class F sortase [Micromonospora sp. SH-82]|uniref:class F sortase n=1 Tax=Micromonospora sp. SH-82 TaxID=3132938 RepID=UPI003EBDFA5D